MFAEPVDRHAFDQSAEQANGAPIVTFAHRQGERVVVHDYCVLTLAADRRAAIVPVSFGDGAFQLTPAMKLKRRAAPASVDAAAASIERAYDRFFDLVEEAPSTDWAPILIETKARLQ